MYVYSVVCYHNRFIFFMRHIRHNIYIYIYILYICTRTTDSLLNIFFRLLYLSVFFLGCVDFFHFLEVGHVRKNGFSCYRLYVFYGGIYLCPAVCILFSFVLFSFFFFFSCFIFFCFFL